MSSVGVSGVPQIAALLAHRNQDGVKWGPMGSKNRKNPDFHSYYFSGSFLMVLGGFRGARRFLNTIRTHLDTAGARLTLPNIEIHQYSCFWECQCSRKDTQNLPFCPGPPQNTFIFFDISKIYIRNCFWDLKF